MSQKQQKLPNIRPRAENVYTLSQRQFNGQLTGMPLSNIGLGNTFRSINIDNHGEWAEGRCGTRLYSSSMPAGTVHAHLDHAKAELVVWQIGTSVYVSDKSLSTFTEVLNISGLTLTDVDASLQPDEDNAILSTPAGILRIVLDYDNGYYMYQVNASRPTTLITDSAETDDKPWGYNYLFSIARIRGTGNRNRTGSDELEFESGTAKNDDSERTYSQIFFENEISDDNEQLVSMLTMPSGVQGMTHYPVYRTLNIGENTAKETAGTTNNAAYFLWVEDVPVLKPYNYTTAAGTVTAPLGTIENMDIGCRLYHTDGSYHVITGINPVTVETSAGLTPADDTYYGVIGTTRAIFVASQTGTTITKTAESRDFSSDDVGKIIYWADGTYSFVTAYVSVDVLTAQWSEAHAVQACATDPTNRRFNDTIRDDASGEGNEVGLLERMLSNSSLYIPLYGFKQLPDANIGLRSEAFFLSATRNEEMFYYSDIGAKAYSLGQYKPDQQYDSTKRPIRNIIPFPNLAVFLLVDATYSAALNTSINKGNSKVAEVISKLYPLTEIDSGIGVYHWASVARINSNLVIAVTSEPAIRMLDGYKWSRANYAVTKDGKKSVQNYIDAIDVTYDIIATYNIRTGYVLWLYTWVDADSVELESDIIIDTPDSVDSDSEWVDSPDDVPADDEIVDTPGQIPL